MGVNRQQALQGGLASHQLVNVREQEDGNITRALTSSQAWSLSNAMKKETIWQHMGFKKKNYIVLGQTVQTQEGACKRIVKQQVYKSGKLHKTRRSFSFLSSLTDFYPTAVLELVSTST